MVGQLAYLQARGPVGGPDPSLRRVDRAGHVQGRKRRPSSVRAVAVRRSGAAMKVSVIIPVYNEFRTFSQVLERVRNARLPEGCEKEIVVVDDGSTDGTSRVLGEHARAGVVVGHHSIINSGKGTALRVGIKLASGDIILVQDGDLEYDPDDYCKIVEPIVRGEADVVYG